MKRETYRKEIKKLEREKRQQHPEQGHVLDQKTTKFNREDFQTAEEKTNEQDLNKVNTTEIFYEEQKKRQWFWSNADSMGKRAALILLVVFALLLALLMLPIIIDLFRGVFYYGGGGPFTWAIY
ncbi:MAG: hypothetical protein Q4A55_04930 [Aerococcus sp.]|nr:hypothetical protein [Aerococcus sp.]